MRATFRQRAGVTSPVVCRHGDAPDARGAVRSGTLWRRRPVIDCQVTLLGIVLNVGLLAVAAVPVAAAVTGLIGSAHWADGTIPALSYGAVWALVYAAGLVQAFMGVDLEFSPRL